ncbi:hypothetical protein PENSPDRAFT_667231 [Peniophora sp. CONT]|nr:hypothetical protein PENSPDRAFT_667231 [Peniophora sp. CONT]
MEVLDGPLALAISDDDPTSFIVRGPNWELAAQAPVIKREVQFYTTLHVTSANNVEADNKGNDIVVVAHNDSATDNQVAPRTVPTPAIESIAPVTIPITPAPVLAGTILSLQQSNQVVRDWVEEHREAIAWVATPRRLVADLRAHLLATSNNPIDRKNLALLSPAVLARLANHGHISRGRKNWMRRLLRYAGDVGTRDIMPDADDLYTILVRTHLGNNGHAHIVPSSMRRKISQAYMFAPGEDFYCAWVSACPGSLSGVSFPEGDVGLARRTTFDVYRTESKGNGESEPFDDLACFTNDDELNILHSPITRLNVVTNAMARAGRITSKQQVYTAPEPEFICGLQPIALSLATIADQ